jgi:DNA-binding transcriptional ArsR family regulator
LFSEQIGPEFKAYGGWITCADCMGKEIRNQHRQGLINYRPFPGLPTMIEILQCLKKHGERLDSEIAKEMGMPLATVRQHVAGLAATGAVVTCNLTRFENGNRIEAWLCRVSGYYPPASPGRKPKLTT